MRSPTLRSLTYDYTVAIPQYLRVKSAAEKHHHDYTKIELKEVADRIQKLAASAQDVHVSVNNHAEEFAPKAAIALRRLLGQPVRDRSSVLERTGELPLGQVG